MSEAFDLPGLPPRPPGPPPEPAGPPREWMITPPAAGRGASPGTPSLEATVPVRRAPGAVLILLDVRLPSLLVVVGHHWWFVILVVIIHERITIDHGGRGGTMLLFQN